MTQQPCVSIITRTKNRVVLLKRAIESVLQQTHKDWRMVIVNDGGPSEPVDTLVEHYGPAAEGRIEVVHNRQSLGMNGASAVGIRHARGDLIGIHDDDDSWAPEFLTTGLATLRSVQRDYPSVRGIATYCNRVLERMDGNIVQIESVEAFNGWAAPGLISLDRMLAGNFIPPISFLFERSAFEELQGEYEIIPYLGDWDFFIRFLVRFDVYMVPQFLAFWHWRAENETAFGNSVASEHDRHVFFHQFLLNRWLRADLAAGRFGVGCYANLRAHLQSLLDRKQVS